MNKNWTHSVRRCGVLQIQAAYYEDHLLHTCNCRCPRFSYLHKHNLLNISMNEINLHGNSETLLILVQTENIIVRLWWARPRPYKDIRTMYVQYKVSIYREYEKDRFHIENRSWRGQKNKSQKKTVRNRELKWEGKPLLRSFMRISKIVTSTSTCCTTVEAP